MKELHGETMLIARSTHKYLSFSYFESIYNQIKSNKIIRSMFY